MRSSSRCTTIGRHTPDECSHIYTPKVEPYVHGALSKIAFENKGGKMCTAGKVAQVLGCDDSVFGCDKGFDYSNMWGAGIGLDFGLDVAASGDDPATFVRLPLDRKAWDPAMHHIAGVSFDFSWLWGGVNGAPHIRVEFPFVLPDNTTLPEGKGTVGLDPSVWPPVPVTGRFPDPRPPSEEHPSGSPIWGTLPGDTWANGPVSPVVGLNHSGVTKSDTRTSPIS